MAYYSNESSVVAKPFVFDETYVPDKIQNMEKQIEQLKTCVEPAKKQMKPLNSWIYGPSGSGKTCAVKWVLSGIDRSRIQWAYINCWDTNTYYLILDKLVRDLRILGAEIQVASVKLDAIERFLHDKPFIIVLDNLDVVPPKERGIILYNLIETGKVGLFCVSYNHRAFTELDARVRSRINPIFVAMPLYEKSIILDILKQRAEHGLVHGTWSQECLAKIAESADGNSRVAIQTLKNAAFIAEKKRGKELRLDHVHEGWTDTIDLRKQSLLSSLTQHHRVLYELVLAQGVVASGDLWRRYLETCKSKGMAAIAPRTYTSYIKQLVVMGFLSAEFVVAKGRKRMLRPVPIASIG